MFTDAADSSREEPHRGISSSRDNRDFDKDLELDVALFVLRYFGVFLFDVELFSESGYSGKDDGFNNSIIERELFEGR